MLGCNSTRCRYFGYLFYSKLVSRFWLTFWGNSQFLLLQILCVFLSLLSLSHSFPMFYFILLQVYYIFSLFFSSESILVLSLTDTFLSWIHFANELILFIASVSFRISSISFWFLLKWSIYFWRLSPFLLALSAVSEHNHILNTQSDNSNMSAIDRV